MSMLFISSALFGQKIDIEGVVIERETNEPLIAVSVVEKGTTNGASTDINGRFKISVESGATLHFSYIGLNSVEMTATEEQMVVYMDPMSELLDELVVIGYGVQKKSVVTASIASVKGEDLGMVMPTRIESVLKGAVSGVNITQTSGQPGADSKVIIRGAGTVNDSNPLYIVDGMPVGGGIDYLNPSDIESVEVLKDAASAAVYGSRGANGVILVTTKSGQKGRATVNYDFSYGWQNPWRKRAVLNATEYGVMMNELDVSEGKSPRYNDPYALGKGTDWQDQVFNYDAPVQEHQLSVSGGTENVNYYISFGSFNQEGIIGGNYNRSNYDRKSLRINNTFKLFNDEDKRDFLTNLSVGTNVAYSRTKSTGISTNSEFGSPLGSALMLSPTLGVYADNPEEVLAQHPTAVTDKNGNVYTIVGDQYNEITNPLAMLSLPGTIGHADKFVGSIWGETELYKGLVFRSSYNFDLAFWGDDGHSIPYYLSSTNRNTESAVSSSKNRGLTWLIENTLSYHNNFNGHDISVLVGQSAQSGRQRLIGGRSYGIIDYTRPHIDGTSQPFSEREAWGSMSQPHRLASYFGRVSYNYKERYMAQVTVRYDGSSRFGPQNKWGTFPSFSLGWNMTNENFMANRPHWISSLKLRASWGKNGNENIPANRYRSIMQGGSNYQLGLDDAMNIIAGSRPQAYPNEFIRWEESIQTDIGFDASLFDGALTFTFDWYKKRSKGMLMQLPLPGYLGNTAPYDNIGKIDNSGVEFDIAYRFKAGDFNFRVAANATYLKNKVVKLGNETGWMPLDNVHLVGEITRAQDGQPFPFFYGLRTNGIFQNQAEIDSYVNSEGKLIQPNAKPGDVRFVDVDGNGTINDDDRVKLGKGTPDWVFGMSFAAEWKGIDFSMQLYSTVGNKIYDASRRTDIPFANMPEYMLGRWTGEGTSNSIPRFASDDANGNWKSSDLYVHNGSFLRVRSLQLGYTLPMKITKKAMIQRLRFFVNAENLFTITSYKGFDPEIASGGTSLGVDRGVYPQPRTISVGASITF